MHTAAIIIPSPQVISKYFNASIVVLLCASALLPDFHRCCLSEPCRTSCGAKNSRNTCPKMNSSASNATATEKIRPATIAMNVIAICIMPPEPSISHGKHQSNGDEKQGLTEGSHALRVAILGQCVPTNTLTPSAHKASTQTRRDAERISVLVFFSCLLGASVSLW